MKVPICDCGRGMISSMCFRGYEYICVPCAKGAPLFNGREHAVVFPQQEKEMRQQYAKDIHKAAFEKGGATCAKCNKPGGNNCEVCNIDYEYEYFGKGIHEKR